MRISFNWLKQYLDISESAEELSSILTSLGLEVEHIEITDAINGGLKGVVVAEVVECVKHPNADRLHLTKINFGGNELIQVVCGAPNVATGQKVLLATEGTTLYPFKSEPITIKKGKIRSEVSEGMLCAEDELGLSENHEGILVLPSNATVGTPAAAYFNLASDTVFEIGLTPNRADAMSHFGVAKDLLAWYRVHKDKNKKLKSRGDISLEHNPGALTIQVNIQDNTQCIRYSGICLKDIVVGESPDWLQKYIRSMGLNPVNNIVDVTNYIMYDMGQPLHAFDYDRIKGHKIQVKNNKEGSKFQTLDGVERTLREKDLMICDGDGNGLCIAGVFGGMDSGVNENTSRIFIESACFNPVLVRNSSMSHNLRTQSAKCFEKGTDPNGTIEALRHAVYLIQEICNAKIDSSLIDIYPDPVKPEIVKLDVQKTIDLSGLVIDREKIKEVLFAMDMKLTDLQNGIIEVEVPTNKPDVKRQADVVEEICRIYGFDQIAIPDQLRIAIQDTGRSLFPVRKQLSEWLTANGLNEIMSLSLVRSAPCIQSGLWKEDELVYIHNTSNIQLDIMRPSIVLGGLESLQFNFNRQQTDLAFYEIGKEYKRSNEKIIENNMLGIWLTGSVQAAHWIRPKPVAQDFFQLKSYVEGIFQLLNIENYKTEELKDHPMFDFAVNYKLNKNQQGVIAGKLAHSICERYDIKKEIWFAALNLDLLAGSMNKQPVMFREFSKFPQIRRDLALVIDAATPFELLKGLAAKHAGELLKDIQLFDVYENTEQLGVGKKSYALSFTFENTDRQMSSGEIEQLMDRLIRLYEKETGAIIRK